MASKREWKARAKAAEERADGDAARDAVAALLLDVLIHRKTIEQLAAERDRARDLAVRLEQENDYLLRKLAAHGILVDLEESE